MAGWMHVKYRIIENIKEKKSLMWVMEKVEIKEYNYKYQTKYKKNV